MAGSQENKHSQNVPRYLLADRNSADFVESISRDNDWIGNHVKETRNLSDLDASLANLMFLDLYVGNYISTWTHDEAIPRAARMKAMTSMRLYDTDYRLSRAFNHGYMQRHNIDETLEMTAKLGVVKAKSELYPSWSPFVWETWVRRGPAYAIMPIYKELFDHRHQPLEDPPPKIINEALLRLAVVSKALRMIRARMLEREGITEGQKQYLQGLDGLLAEYDLLMTLYEEVDRSPLGSSSWHLPAPPSMDYGFHDNPKADAITVHLQKGAQTTFSPYTMKLKSVRKDRRFNDGIRRMSLDDVGCVYVKDGKLVRYAGARCDSFLEDWARMFPEDNRYTTDEKVLAEAMAILNQPFAKIEHFVKELDEGRLGGVAVQPLTG